MEKIQCNLDDMTPEGIGFAMKQLFDKGALDVYTTPVGMKKNRPESGDFSGTGKNNNRKERGGKHGIQTADLVFRSDIHRNYGIIYLIKYKTTHVLKKLLTLCYTYV